MDGHADDINLWMCLRIAPRTADHRCRQVGDYESHTSPFLVGLRSVIDALCVDCIRVPALISPDRPSARATIGVHLVVVSHLECLCLTLLKPRPGEKMNRKTNEQSPRVSRGNIEKKGTLQTMFHQERAFPLLKTLLGRNYTGENVPSIPHTWHASTVYPRSPASAWPKDGGRYARLSS